MALRHSPKDTNATGPHRHGQSQDGQAKSQERTLAVNTIPSDADVFTFRSVRMVGYPSSTFVRRPDSPPNPSLHKQWKGEQLSGSAREFQRPAPLFAGA